ncbi:hypothetical protein SODALDRAFT_361214 [Sodiomyces alkalinus F11]|uniref:Uncharacterized protein n=1 Tax=Sodiomyces alkalinus (strain CBS 110278 / VKM F-3762 / F11) TaxID=1314773 RepID=A0A3N2PSL2_SODAK|nr:hypothetical protein SODALDRAFT_361214 [Sodiomyces alkalinus F11]ROT37503.1 hypothetical protein SODALDRAFT_361214 [Sodiomyces alkalinus F11]
MNQVRNMLAFNTETPYSMGTSATLRGKDFFRPESLVLSPGEVVPTPCPHQPQTRLGRGTSFVNSPTGVGSNQPQLTQPHPRRPKSSSSSSSSSLYVTTPAALILRQAIVVLIPFVSLPSFVLSFPSSPDLSIQSCSPAVVISFILRLLDRWQHAILFPTFSAVAVVANLALWIPRERMRS